MPEDSTKVELLECVCLQVAKDLEVRDFTALDELLKYNPLDEIRAYISNLEIEENYNK